MAFGDSIFIALLDGSTDDVRQSILDGACIEALTDGATPLMIAAAKDYFDKAQLLLQMGANVNATTLTRLSPLQYAVGNSTSLEIVKLLIENGADMEARDGTGRTVLMIAAAKDYFDKAQLLVQRGANVNATTTRRLTPLHFAAGGGKSPEIVRLLLDAGVDIEARDDTGRTALFVAASCSREHTAVVQALLDAGADLNALDEHERTALHEMGDGFVETVCLFIQNGADVNALDQFERTPLEMTASKGFMETVRVLIGFGADVNSANLFGHTALYCAAHNGLEETVAFLIERGADLNTVDMYGRTALHMAAFFGFVDTVRVLVERGADVMIVENQGRTAAEMVCLGNPATALIKAEVERIRNEAFAMGNHDRVGAASWVRALDPEVVRMILWEQMRKTALVDIGEDG
jgi:ankyrin repeat protein